jgi:hypothetical protein
MNEIIKVLEKFGFTTRKVEEPERFYLRYRNESDNFDLTLIAVVKLDKVVVDIAYKAQVLQTSNAIRLEQFLSSLMDEHYNKFGTYLRS